MTPKGRPGGPGEPDKADGPERLEGGGLPTEPGKPKPPEPPEKPERPGGDDRRWMGNLGLFTQLGLTMAVCIFIGFAAGRWADLRLGSTPWLMFLGALLGAAAAFKVLFDLAKGK